MAVHYQWPPDVVRRQSLRDLLMLVDVTREVAEMRADAMRGRR